MCAAGVAPAEREQRPLLVHCPEVEAVVGMRSGHEQLRSDDVESVGVVLRVSVQQLGVLIDLPEDDLAVEAARHDPVLRVLLHAQHIRQVTIVAVDRRHRAQVPDLQAAVVRRGVELIVLLVELAGGDRVSVAEEALDQFLIVQVPNAHQPILAAADEVLAVVGHGKRADLVEVALRVAVELAPHAKLSFLAGLNVPQEYAAVFRAGDQLPIARQPLKTSDCFLMALVESRLKLTTSVIIGDLME